MQISNKNGPIFRFELGFFKQCKRHLLVASLIMLLIFVTL